MSSVSVGCSTTRDLPRMQRVYEWSAEELGEPRLLELAHQDAIARSDLRSASKAKNLVRD